MASDEMIKLKELLEGAKVLEIKESDSPESICEMVVKRGEERCSFTLFATDLGWWIANVKNHNGVFQTFQDLLEIAFEHYDTHGDYEANSYESVDYPKEHQIGFKCKMCGKEFLSSMTAVRNSEYFDLLTTVDKRRKFARILSGHYVQNKDWALEHLKDIGG